MKTIVLFCASALALSSCSWVDSAGDDDDVIAFNEVVEPEPTTVPVTITITPPDTDPVEPDPIIITDPVVVTPIEPEPDSVVVEPLNITFNTLEADNFRIQEIQQVCQARYNEFNEFFLGRDSDAIETATRIRSDGIQSLWLSEASGEEPDIDDESIEADGGGAIFRVDDDECDIEVIQGFTDQDGDTQIFNNLEPTEECLTDLPTRARNVERFALYTIAGVDYGQFAVDYTINRNGRTIFRQQYGTRYSSKDSEFFIDCQVNTRRTGN